MILDLGHKYNFVAKRDKNIQFVTETESRLQTVKFEARVHKAILLHEKCSVQLIV